MKIKVYQITNEKDARNLMFCRYDFVEKRGGVDPSEYALVFDGDVTARTLDEVYSICNGYPKLPEGYSGRSISVSDVVVTEDGAFFCDSFGWVELFGGWSDLVA